MRVLITSAHSFEGETGSASITVNLAHELSKSHQVLFTQLGDSFRVTKITKNLRLLTIPSSNLNGTVVPFLTPSSIANMYTELDKFKPDVIHAQNIIFASLVALIWSIKHNVPFILTLHAPPHQDLLYVFPKLEKNKLLNIADQIFTRTYNRIIISNSTLVIALNDVITNSLKIISPKTPTVTINNGIYLDKFKKIAVDKPKNIVKFIFPGSYLDRKNQMFLLNVFRYLPKNYVLDLYGLKSTGGKYLDKLEFTKKKYNLTNVNINDYADEPKLLKAFKNSHYMMSASIKEVQSLSILESLAAGKPIIALENETTRDVIKNNECLILPQSTSSKIFAKKVVQYVSTSKSRYQQISAICRTNSKRFDINSVAQKISDTYKSTLRDFKAVNDSNIYTLQIFLAISVVMGVFGKVAEKLRPSQSFEK